MKYTLIVAILSLIAAPISQAQLAGTLNQVVSPVRPIIDRTSSDLKAIREEARRKAQSSIEGTRDLSTVASGVLSDIPAPQFIAPAATTILSTSGQVVVNEVAVESGFLAVEKEWLFLGEEADKVHFQGANIEIQKAQFLPALSQWLFKVNHLYLI